MPRLLMMLALQLAIAFTPIRAQEGGTAAQPLSDSKTAIPYVEREFYLPYSMASPPGLAVLEVRADIPGRHPLALMTHGTAATPAERAQVTPWRFLPQALWFARRGYVVLVVVRRGYGLSGGEIDDRQGGCGNRGSFTAAAEAGADDMAAAARYALKLPEVDASTTISVGVSTGGLVQAALSAHPITGLKAAISFAGGRGGDGKGHNCNLDGLVSAFRGFGKHNQVPMLWIYSENDHWFPPEMATRFDEAFKKGGGNNEFVMVPPDGEDGHHLFGHVSKWSPIVEEYLRRQDLLPLKQEVLSPPALPNLPAPIGLPAAGVAAFQQFLANGPFKAFASDGAAAWGYSTGQFTQEIADREAVENCKRKNTGTAACRVIERGPR